MRTFLNVSSNSWPERMYVCSHWLHFEIQETITEMMRIQGELSIPWFHTCLCVYHVCEHIMPGHADIHCDTESARSNMSNYPGLAAQWHKPCYLTRNRPIFPSHKKFQYRNRAIPLHWCENLFGALSHFSGHRNPIFQKVRCSSYISRPHKSELKPRCIWLTCSKIDRIFHHFLTSPGSRRDYKSVAPSETRP